MSIREMQQDLDMIIKPQLEEILKLLKNQQNADNIKDNIEAAAAKIITELKSIIQDCPCNKIILEALNKEPSQDNKIITLDDKNRPCPSTGQWKYSYPSYNVGNERMGTGKNPTSLTWPFGSDKKSLS